MNIAETWKQVQALFFRDQARMAAENARLSEMLEQREIALQSAQQVAEDALADSDRLQTALDRLQADKQGAFVRPSPRALLPPYRSVEQFRWAVLAGYGFNVVAVNTLATFPITDTDLTRLNSTGPDGQPSRTYPDHIVLYSIQHEAALHEMCHVLHERDWRLFGSIPPDQGMIFTFLENYQRLERETEPNFAEAAAFAKLQLRGDGGGFPGVLALHDWDHAFVSLASWCMGKFRSGPRVLPDYMWPYFERFFTGDVLLTPYYEPGGIL